MPPSRTIANELLKLLAAVSDPLYVVGPKRRLLFVNGACGVWAGIEPATLIGQECKYGMAADAPLAEAIAAALCPPPEALSGTRLKAPIVLPNQPDGPRQVEFIPLSLSEGDSPGVLAIVGPTAADATTATSEDAPTIELHARLQRYRGRLASHYHVDRLLGDSPAMRRVRTQVKLAAASSVSVLVVGPAHSGDYIGRAIHYGSDGGTAGPLIPFSCPLLDVELLQATLRGLARSKATSQRPATLLLNGIDSLGEGAQAELARSLSAGPFPARIISTTTSILTQLAAESQFQRDLACLLSTLTIHVPRLAERLGDLPLLVQWYIEQANLSSSKQLGGCSPEALDRLADYSWPGDLTELEAFIDEAHSRAEGPLIFPQDLPQRLALASQASARPAKPDETIKLEQYLAEIEHELITRALKRAKGNKTKAASLLGMTRPRFYRRLVQLGLEKP